MSVILIITSIGRGGQGGQGRKPSYSPSLVKSLPKVKYHSKQHEKFGLLDFTRRPAAEYITLMPHNTDT